MAPLKLCLAEGDVTFERLVTLLVRLVRKWMSFVAESARLWQSLTEACVQALQGLIAKPEDVLMEKFVFGF